MEHGNDRGPVDGRQETCIDERSGQMERESSESQEGSDDNRCIGSGVGNYAVNQQSTARRTQSTSTATFETVIELQGVNGGVVSSQPFWPSALEEWNQSTSSEVGQHSGQTLSRLERAGDNEVRAEELPEILKIAQMTPTLDEFAASHNHKLERLCGINSPIAEDGLMVPWKDEVVLAYPPVRLIARTIQKAKSEKAQVILLLPNWRG
ncbi:uncharacterized protein MONOS_8955 [Monocercomonoides exilis]|uniref:uncharacterized protein n=1 Tax=Monocercomonoides exilis TaxID=2049356 RepID=UPI003559CBA9|nr:hypothetical protein MONOS_8955 [Monocercomonoides exilis]|eukprot:MONOS_8955.1-p1 / transcript=MONOS_8955.1 / gene=MONOS_8955 / organism=Monocercomonoides_exilis_PA203 / gene_product=unspecified product / transcript_product=unspecified product / location=Mono_scaffold00353:14558-15549(+) / protein_length=208 / sequence_SO=supercontig / SO=protein_coding / is_pseudo=false